MNKILRKRLMRDLRSGAARYFALVMLIIMGMYIIVGMDAAAETVIQRTAEHAENNKVEDGLFSVFLPLSDEQENEVEKMGVTLEGMFYFDAEAENGAVLRIMKNRKSIDLAELDEGRLAEKAGEAVVEKRYCEEHGLSVGDRFEISGRELKITGIGCVPDYDMPLKDLSDTSVQSSIFGLAFVTEEEYEELKTLTKKQENFCYAYRLNGVASHGELKEKVRSFEPDISPIVKLMMSENDIQNLISFVKAQDNPRIFGAANDRVIYKNVAVLAGVIVMVLFTYVISVFTIDRIRRESSVIGTLYALGAKRKDLIRYYLTLPVVIAFVGGIVGTLMGLSKIGLEYQMSDCYSYYSIPKLDAVYPPYLIVYGIVMPPVVSALVNFLVIRKKLSQTALSLIRNEQKQKLGGSISLGKMGFVRKFQLRQLIREIRAEMTVVIGMLISLTIFILGSNCYVLCNNLRDDTARDTKFEYMYTLKFPPQEVSQDAEKCYAQSLSKTYLGYTIDVTVMGIDEDNAYFDVETVKGTNKAVISASAAQKYSLSAGDTLSLFDSANDKEYEFSVESISGYSAGLTVFMDIDSMRELFGKSEDYYNVLLSDSELDIGEEYIYSVTQKSDIERSSDIFWEMMMPLVAMLTAASIIIFCMVMYLMTGIMIDRASFGISLSRIFGFRNSELKKLYLNANGIVIAVSAVIGIPLARLAINKLYPAIIANVACGINLKYEWYMYIGIFVGILLIYAAVELMLVRRIKRITPAEVLKNRE